ncbi:MAG: hypothetical protein JW806_07900 [Sedimentisphaerales bacterium]|nr:hypothetical protein [Sedimentisphaerales bacterium]
MTKNKPALSGWAMLIFWWAMILFALHASTHMVGAGDTWVAMACGRHFLNHGVDTVEPFSFNSHKPGPTEEEVQTWPAWAQWITEKVGIDTVKFWHPTGWVNQNWLTHVFFYWLTHESPFADAETYDKPIEGQNISYNSLVYWKYVLYIATIIAVYYTGRILGVNPALSAVFSCFALYISRTFLDVRPAGFSNMLTAILLLIFVLTVYKNYLYIWLIVPVTALWCNLHGGYVYMFIVLVPFIGLHLVTLLPKKTAMCVYYSAGWLLIIALAVKFRSHIYLRNIEFSSSGLILFASVMVGVNIVLVAVKNVKEAMARLYHIFGTLIVFFTALIAFYPEGMRMMMRQPFFNTFVTDARSSFFIVFMGFVIVAVLLETLKTRLKTISLRGWIHTVAAAITAFIVMIIANPFRLTNLTHTFVVSVSEDAKLWKTVNEWHPAFEWANPVGDEIPFLIMYILGWILVIFWFICLILKPSGAYTKQAKKAPAQEDISQYEKPKIDLPMIVIAALTIYMAIGSRRFIPIAAIAACPLIAMFLDSGIKMMVDSRRFIPIAVITAVIMTISIIQLAVYKIIILTSMQIAVITTCLIMTIVIVDLGAKMLIMSRKQQGTSGPIVMPQSLQQGLIVMAALAALYFTGRWGKQYKEVYLDPWPDSPYLTSEFMRMTASYAKPFRACQFLRDNNIKGKVFNYWTEGGFLAYGQFPDPNTGKTPLQLFMDGRAQAAYNTEAYRHWMYIMSGGDVARTVKREGRMFTSSDYIDAGEWISQALQNEDIDVIIMPAAEFNKEFVKSLDTNVNWRTVLSTDMQRIYVDVRKQQGRELYIGVFQGQTKFPDEHSKRLTLGYNVLRLQDESEATKGFELLVQALAIQPSQVAALELVRTVRRYPQLADLLKDIFTQYFDDFLENQQDYMKKDGYRHRIIVSTIVADYLIKANRTNAALVKKYNNYLEESNNEQLKINETTRW